MTRPTFATANFGGLRGIDKPALHLIRSYLACHSYPDVTSGEEWSETLDAVRTYFREGKNEIKLLNLVSA